MIMIPENRDSVKSSEGHVEASAEDTCVGKHTTCATGRISSRVLRSSRVGEPAANVMATQSPGECASGSVERVLGDVNYHGCSHTYDPDRAASAMMCC